MAEPAPRTPCEHCDGKGVWASGCESPTDCFQCHGTGVQRARGNCEACVGWGRTVLSGPCEACGATGAVAAPVALYRCEACLRSFAAAPASARCPRDASHALALLAPAP